MAFSSSLPSPPARDSRLDSRRLQVAMHDAPNRVMYAPGKKSPSDSPNRHGNKVPFACLMVSYPCDSQLHSADPALPTCTPYNHHD